MPARTRAREYAPANLLIASRAASGAGKPSPWEKALFLHY